MYIMQEKSYIFLGADYNEPMSAGRPPKSKRPFFGERLAVARQEAGLTQRQLAEKMDTTQRMITYWEREGIALRPDQLARLADTLNVTADYLIGRVPTRQRGIGPMGKTKRLFASLSNLPRHQQEKIFTILEPFIAQHSTGHISVA